MGPGEAWMQLAGLPRFLARRVGNRDLAPRGIRSKFSTRSVENCGLGQKLRIAQIKLLDVEQTLKRIPCPIILPKPFRQGLHQMLSVLGSVGAPLLLLDDLTPDQPIRHHLRRIDRASEIDAGRFENLANARINRR